MRSYAPSTSPSITFSHFFLWPAAFPVFYPPFVCTTRPINTRTTRFDRVYGIHYRYVLNIFSLGYSIILEFFFFHILKEAEVDMIKKARHLVVYWCHSYKMSTKLHNRYFLIIILYIAYSASGEKQLYYYHVGHVTLLNNIKHIIIARYNILNVTISTYIVFCNRLYITASSVYYV